jgi:hypothetical protein
MGVKAFHALWMRLLILAPSHWMYAGSSIARARIGTGPVTVKLASGETREFGLGVAGVEADRSRISPDIYATE